MNHIKIDLERTISDIDRNIFGGYMELGVKDTTFKHLDILDPAMQAKGGLPAEVRAVLERVKMANMRFGGNFFSGYRWLDGVGPRAERPARHELAWNSIVPNNFGTNEFVMLCRSLGAEPYLNTNCGDGDMREAADWVEYCNGTGDSALAKLRRQHGFEKPHNVKYWSIGNEVDSPGQIGYKTPQEYARAVTEYGKVMKRVDPTIKLSASAACSWEDAPLGPQFLYRKTEWVERAQLMLEQAGDRIDYMALHKYAHPYTDDSFETLMAFAAGFEEHLSAYEGLIKAVSLERGIKHAVDIAVDEWGIIYIPAEARQESPITVTVDASGQAQLPAEEKITAHHGRKNVIGLEQAPANGAAFEHFYPPRPFRASGKLHLDADAGVPQFPGTGERFTAAGNLLPVRALQPHLRAAGAGCILAWRHLLRHIQRPDLRRNPHPRRFRHIR